MRIVENVKDSSRPRRRITPVVFITLVCLFSDLPVQSQEKNIVDIGRAVQMALRSNHDLEAAYLDMEGAEARVREAVGLALPTIDLQAKYTRALKKPVFFLPDFDDPGSGRIRPIEIGSANSVDMTLSATQVLFNTAVFTGVGTAKIYARAAREMYRAKEMETVSAVRKAFYGVLVAAEVRSMMRENLANAEENFRNVTILAEQGLVSEYDQLRGEVGVANLRPEVMRAENNYSLALNALKIAMGLPYAEEMEIRDSLEYQPVTEDLIREASAILMTGNPTLNQLRYQSEVNDAFVSIERSSYLPVLSAFGNYQYTAQKNDFSIARSDFIGSSVVGLSLSVNIFNGFRTGSRVEQARLSLRKSQEQIAGFETSIRTALESTILQLRRAYDRIEAQGRTVEQAGRGYRIAATRFASGAGTQLEVNDAQLALTQARVNKIQAVYDYLIASTDLDQILGRMPEYARSRLE